AMVLAGALLESIAAVPPAALAASFAAAPAFAAAVPASLAAAAALSLASLASAAALPLSPQALSASANAAAKNTDTNLFIGFPYLCMKDRNSAVEYSVAKIGFRRRPIQAFRQGNGGATDCEMLAQRRWIYMLRSMQGAASRQRGLRSKAQHGAAQARFAGRPDLVEATGQRLRLLRLIDAERGARLLEVKAMQIMPAIDDHQRIGRYLTLRTGLVDRQRVAVVTQQAQQMRASALQVARVVHDDVQSPAADLAQER